MTAKEITKHLDEAFATFAHENKVRFWPLRNLIKTALAEDEILVARDLLRGDVRSDDFPETKANLLSLFPADEAE